MLCHGGPGLGDMGGRPERLPRRQELTDRPVRSEAETVGSLERALPRVRQVIVPEAGHLPWVEDPRGFRGAGTAALR
ncbi:MULTISPECIES: hypothetical protein [unclassified Streptomyces]|uniref:hypothetical protein n=1 Tax=unclassified Streptomyces TaxID=2593676 RepID=UPI00163DD16B|nr:MULTISPECIES: hypothetical protein [unclassified Streptomyces]